MATEPPAVTVVIPTHNRHSRLRQTVARLGAQTFEDFEVVVVDDCSEPPVTAVLEGVLPPHLRIRIQRLEANRGPGAARNAGVANARGRLIAFLDDDVDTKPGWLAAHVATMADEGVVSLGALLPPRGWKPSAWTRWEARTLVHEYGRIARGEYEPGWRQFFTGNAVVRRADVIAVGGFDETFLRAEDIELGVRLAKLGRRFVLTDGAASWHDSRRSLRSWMRIPGLYAKYDLAIDRKHPDLKWLEVVQGEQATRNLLLRFGRKALKAAHARVPAAWLAAGSARAVYALGARELAMKGLSLAYDLVYHESLDRELALRAGQPGATELALATSQGGD